MTVSTQIDLQVIELPGLAHFGSDVIHVIEATPLLLSPNGEELLVAVSINTSTSGQKIEYLLYNTQRNSYELNLANEIGQGDASTVNITAVNASWASGDLIVTAAYEDLLDNSFNAGYSNKVALLTADAIELDIIEAVTGEIANGAVTALALNDSGQRLVIETSASNLLADAYDANDSSDIYTLDITNSTVARVSVLGDGTELSSAAKLLGVVQATDNSLHIAFETTGAEFATDDSNNANDVYLSTTSGISLVSADTQGVAIEASASNALGTSDGWYFVTDSSAVTTDDTDVNDDIFVYSGGTNALVSAAFDQLNAGSAFAVELVEVLSGNELVVSVDDATFNGTDVSGQLLLMDTQANSLEILSTDANGDVGDDVSVNYMSAEDNKNAFVYQTYATNIAGYVVPAMVTNIATDTLGPMGVKSSIPIGAYNVPIDDVMIWDLSEWSEFGSGGYLTIYVGETDTVAAQLDASSMTLSSDGMQLSIDLSGALQADTFYSFKVDAGILIDAAGNDSLALAREITVGLVNITLGFSTSSETKSQHDGQYFVRGEVWGLDAAETFVATDRSVEIYAHGGNDTIVGSSKWDVIHGGRGDDHITAGGGADYLSGGEGNDTFQLSVDGVWSAGLLAGNIGLGSDIGTKQVVVLEGMNQFLDVVMSNGDASDIIDTVLLTGGNDAFFLHDALSTSSPATSTVDARIAGIEVIKAGAGNDLIDLTSPDYSLATLDMQLYGEAGNDLIWAAQGDDTLDGGAGDDVLFGSSGNDTLTGGAGADVFEFTATSGSDVITDYDVSAGDIIKFYCSQANMSAGVTTVQASNFLTFQVDTGADVTVAIDGLTEDSHVTANLTDVSADLYVQFEVI